MPPVTRLPSRLSLLSWSTRPRLNVCIGAVVLVTELKHLLKDLAAREDRLGSLFPFAIIRPSVLKSGSKVVESILGAVDCARADFPPYAPLVRLPDSPVDLAVAKGT